MTWRKKDLYYGPFKTLFMKLRNMCVSEWCNIWLFCNALTKLGNEHGQVVLWFTNKQFPKGNTIISDVSGKRFTPQRVLVVRSSRQELVLSVRGLLELLLTPKSIEADEWIKSWKRVFFQHFWTRCIATTWPSPTPSYEPHNNHFNFSFYRASLRHV